MKRSPPCSRGSIRPPSLLAETAASATLNRLPVRKSSPWFAIALLFVSLLIAARTGRGDEPHTIPVGIIVVNSAAEAEALIARLKHGADFSTVAREHSIDPTGYGGGFLGNVDPESLRLELRNALHGLESGQISGVVRIPAGYAILKVLEPGKPAPKAPTHNGTLALTAPASVRLTPVTSGYGEFLQSIRRAIPADPAWRQDLKATCDTRTSAPAAAAAAVRLRLDERGSEMDPLELAYTRYTLALLLASQGKFDESLEKAEEAYEGAMSSHSPRLAGHEDQLAGTLEEAIGGDYLHRAMMATRIATPIDSSRIFPWHPGAPGLRPADVEKAVSYFTKALKRDPSNNEIQYLLNLAYMAQGTWPASVPKQFLMPPSAFASKDDVGRFLDVAPAAGVNLLGTSGGAIAEDLDNDGLLDIFTTQIDDCGPPQFYHNNGDGTFSNRSRQAGLLTQTGGLYTVQADYNNDGCVDVLVMRGGWEYPRRRSLLRNNCDGTFTDVTAQAGLADPVYASQAAVWTDINNDGLLDLFIANESGPAQLFLNKGDGTFVDIAHQAGVDRVMYSKGAAAGDYDNDGFPDLYVSNFNGPNFLYHNNGNLTFTEVGEQAGVQAPWMSFPCWFFDYDNDGWPDLFVASYYFSVEEVARGYMGLPRKGETLKLYHNNGDGTFKDVTVETGLNKVFMPMGSNFGDIDNDGFLDIYLGVGDPSFLSVVPNVLLHNIGGRRFEDISASSGTGALAKGHGTAFADFGNNGNEDILIVMGGPTVGDHYQTRLFRNPGHHGNDWISLHLVGVKSNRSAIGARITVTVRNEGGAPRKIYRTVDTGSSFGANPLEQHIGLGKAATIDDIQIWWPASKTRQNFNGVEPNQFLEIREFAADYRKLARKSFVVGGAAAK